MQRFPFIFQRAVLTTACLPLLVSIGAAQNKPDGAFTFNTFTVPGASDLALESINDSGTISGYYTDASGDVVGLIRTSGGTVSTYTDPLDTTSPTFTAGGQINRSGTAVGEFFNTADGTYEGYIYRTTSKTFTTYVVPGQVPNTTVSVEGINSKGNLCGFVIPPPYTIVNAFTEVSGVVNIFAVNGSTDSACYALNDSGASTGFYTDSTGVDHGWVRTSAGAITTVDVPGAATVPGTAPCVSTAIAGTVALGINNAGYVSGHYWDSSYNEHGFLMTPGGKFISINVPGAYQTSGGGLNNHETVTGHYADSSCNTYGYTAAF